MTNKWIYPAALIIAVFIGFFLYQKYKVAPHIDLNTLDLSDTHGTKFDFDSLKGKKVVLCFGASWCVNCIEELESIAKLKDEQLSDIHIVLISDESLEKIERFRSRKKYPFTFLKLNSPFAAIGIYSIPTTYLVNTHLQVVKETVGYMNWEDASTREHYKKLMN